MVVKLYGILYYLISITKLSTNQSKKKYFIYVTQATLKRILGKYGIQVKENETLILQPNTQSPYEKFNFIVILLKIAKNNV